MTVKEVAESGSMETESRANLRIIQGVDALDEVAAAWDLLATSSGSPMQHYAWARAWAEVTSGPDVELHIIVLGQPHPTAIAPLVRHSEGPERLVMLGADELFEPMDFLFASPSALAELLSALLQLRLPVFLKRVPADSLVVAAMKSSYRGQGLVVRRPSPGCPWIPLDEGWIQPEQRLSAGRRSDIRRARRIAERMGPVTCEVLCPTAADLEGQLEEALRVEAAGWKGRMGTSLLNDALRGRFYRRYAAAACQQGILRVCFLRIGERVAAMQLAVEGGGRFWLLKIGYDEKFARCSPGTLLALETIRYAASKGLNSYEFLGTAEAWTKMWTPHIRRCVSVWAYPRKVQGMATLTADVAQIAWRRLSRTVQGRK